MMMRKLIFFCCFIVLTVSNAAPVKILFWHSMAGQLGLELQHLVQEFNHSQDQYVIQLAYKGDYIESLTSFAAAFQAHQAPALVQVFEVGRSIMLLPKGIIKPVNELMQEQKSHLPEEDFFPAVFDYYQVNGRLMAMPFNISIPVMYYNADILKKFGYNNTSYPKTWDELEQLAKQLIQAGYHCAYTSAYPSWIFIESFSALHNYSMLDKASNTLHYNAQPMVQLLERLQRWQRLHYFEYGGRGDDATILFTSGRCPIFSQSSGAYRSLSQLVPFHLGVAQLPLDQGVSSVRHNNVIGGGAIWVVSGQSAMVYQGIARFFSYLAQAPIQQRWHEKTGYLPLGVTGIYKNILASSQVPTLLLARAELSRKNKTNHANYLVAQNQIRAVNDEALEKIFAAIASPQQALDEAVNQGTHVLNRFIQNTRQ